jgi:D-specific alpha-keto acid dehydrogenase
MITIENINRTYDGNNEKTMVKTGITLYGCEQDEKNLFQELAPRFGADITITDKPLSEDNVALAQGNRCISVSHKTQVTPAMLRALSRAGVVYISTRSAGYNHIDIKYAQRVGISVGNVTYSPDSVADYTLMLMLMAVRNIKPIIKHVDTNDFRLGELRGKELRDMTVGVIGTGRIGSAVIDRLRGFGCRVVAYDHRPKISAEYVSLDKLLRCSDIITLHTPLNTDTHHLLSRQRLAHIKPGAFIVNTGRGSLIETEALISALESGSVGGAALDVLEGEEGIFYADFRTRPVHNKLLLRLQMLPNVIITPHAAYYTEHALHDIAENTIINCLNFIRK